MRMPRVKKTLDEYFKSSKIELGQHLNGTYVCTCYLYMYTFARLIFVSLFSCSLACLFVCLSVYFFFARAFTHVQTCKGHTNMLIITNTSPLINGNTI